MWWCFGLGKPPTNNSIFIKKKNLDMGLATIGLKSTNHWPFAGLAPFFSSGEVDLPGFFPSSQTHSSFTFAGPEGNLRISYPKSPQQKQWHNLTDMDSTQIQICRLDLELVGFQRSFQSASFDDLETIAQSFHPRVWGRNPVKHLNQIIKRISKSDKFFIFQHVFLLCQCQGGQ